MKAPAWVWVVGAVVLVVVGLLLPKLLLAAAGGFGAFAATRRVVGARVDAAQAQAESHKATTARNERAAAANAATAARIEAASRQDAPPSETPVSTAERERRRKELGSWDD